MLSVEPPGAPRFRRGTRGDRRRLGPESIRTSSRCLSRRLQWGLHGRFCVCDPAVYGRLDLRTGTGFAPDSQLSSHQLRAFVHTGQAVMTGAAAALENLLVDALSVVSNPQPEPALVVEDFHFDLTRLSVPERIAQRLDSNPIEFIPDDRSYIA